MGTPRRRRKLGDRAYQADGQENHRADKCEYSMYRYPGKPKRQQ